MKNVIAYEGRQLITVLDDEGQKICLTEIILDIVFKDEDAFKDYWFIIDGRLVKDARRRFTQKVGKLLMHANKCPFKITIENVESAHKYIKAMYDCYLNPSDENNKKLQDVFGLYV